MRGILLEFLRLWLMLDPFRMLTVRKPHQLVWEIYSLVSPLNFWVHFQNHRTMRHTHIQKIAQTWQWLKSSLSCFHFIICLFLDYQKMFLDDSYLFFRLIHITIYILLVDKGKVIYNWFILQIDDILTNTYAVSIKNLNKFALKTGIG